MSVARRAGEEVTVRALGRPAPPCDPMPEERAARWDLDLAGQVRYYLEEHGETRPVPVLGGFVAEDHPGDRVRVSWRLPGPPVLASVRRRRNLRRYERLLRSWGMATELHLDAPEPYLACRLAPP